MVKPYQQQVNENFITRTFDSRTEQAELVWHRDKSDRFVTIVEGKDWKIQMDNTIPRVLSPGETLFIPRNTYHRLIKGTDKLVCEIKEI